MNLPLGGKDADLLTEATVLLNRLLHENMIVQTQVNSPYIIKQVNAWLHKVVDRTEEVFFTSKDRGCIADGTFGHEHVRNVLAVVVAKLNLPLADRLSANPSDSMEEEDEAIALLNEHTAEGLVWEFDDGNLVLRYRSTEEMV